jgi:phage terminase Nu1 subunit (DNA packaging protein)
MAGNASRSKSQNLGTSDSPLKGWKQIAEFLGQSVAVAQEWGRDGMPVTHSGRSVAASRQQLQQWLGRESGSHAPTHISSGETDLSSILKEGMADARKQRRHKNKSKVT